MNATRMLVIVGFILVLAAAAFICRDEIQRLSTSNDREQRYTATSMLFTDLATDEDHHFILLVDGRTGRTWRLINTDTYRWFPIPLTEISRNPSEGETFQPPEQ